MAPAIQPMSTYEYLEVTARVFASLVPLTYTLSAPDWLSGTLEETFTALAARGAVNSTRWPEVRRTARRPDASEAKVPWV